MDLLLYYLASLSTDYPSNINIGITHPLSPHSFGRLPPTICSFCLITSNCGSKLQSDIVTLVPKFSKSSHIRLLCFSSGTVPNYIFKKINPTNVIDFFQYSITSKLTYMIHLKIRGPQNHHSRTPFTFQLSAI